MTESKDFTSDELQRVADSFWLDLANWENREAQLPCPSCGANASVLMSPTYSYPVHLQVHCSACNRRGSVKSTETPGGSLSEAQLVAAKRDYQDGRKTYCPHCQTELVVREEGLTEPVLFAVHCPRCGASGERRWS